MRRKNVAYIRVANKDDYAVDNQKRIIDDYAKKHNLAIDCYYIDNGYSGINLERPQLQQLLRDIKSKKITDRVIVVDASRLGRNFENIEKICRRISSSNVKLISTKENETLTFSLVSAGCEVFREDQRNRRLAMSKLQKAQKRGIAIVSPYQKGTLKDNKFKTQERAKYRKQGMDEIRFIYNKERI